MLLHSGRRDQKGGRLLRLTWWLIYCRRNSSSASDWSSGQFLDSSNTIDYWQFTDKRSIWYNKPRVSLGSFSCRKFENHALKWWDWCPETNIIQRRIKGSWTLSTFWLRRLSSQSGTLMTQVVSEAHYVSKTLTRTPQRLNTWDPPPKSRFPQFNPHWMTHTRCCVWSRCCVTKVTLLLLDHVELVKLVKGKEKQHKTHLMLVYAELFISEELRGERTKVGETKLQQKAGQVLEEVKITQGGLLLY